MKHSMCCIAIVLLLLGMAVMPVSAASTISGIVTDAVTSLAVYPGTVTLSSGQSTTTASDGSYQFTGLGANTYTVTASSPAHYQKQKTVVVGTDVITNVNFALVPMTWTPAVSDDFSRPDSTNLGTTEDSNHYPWLLGGSESRASISSYKLLLSAEVDWVIGGVSVGGDFLPANLDVSADVTMDGNSWVGIAYRQDVVGSFDNADAGYLVYCHNNGWVVLHRLGTITSAYVSKDWTNNTPHNLRVRVVGSQHQVWLDGTLVIDFVNGAKLGGGYVSLMRHGDSTNRTFDTFRVSTIADPPTGTISGKIADADNPTVGIENAIVRTSLGDEAVTDANGNYTLPVSSVPGIMRVTISHNDYYSNKVDDVEVLPGQTTTVNALLTHLPTPTADGIVTDTFARSDGYDLGVTEDTNHWPWVKGIAETATSAQIMLEELYLAPGPLRSGVSVGGDYYPADIDLTVDVRIPNDGDPTDDWAGIAYRQAVPGTYGGYNGQNGSQAGYLVYFPQDGTKVNIVRDDFPDPYFASVTLATPIDWTVSNTVRVRAFGSYHQVWVNGDLVLEATQSDKLAGGYVSLLRRNNGAYFDNLNVTSYGSDPGVISGVVTDAANPSIKIANALVTLNVGRTAVTNAQGEYTIENLPYGTYTAVVDADGYYRKITSGVTLTESSPAGVLDVALYAVPPAMNQVYDTFTRPNSSELGTTEDSLHLPWLKPISGDTSPQILDGILAVDPFLIPWVTSIAGVTMGNGFLPADIDMSVDMKIWEGNWGGIGYRQGFPGTCDNHNGADITQAGYYVFCPPAGGFIHLMRTGNYLANAVINPAVDWNVPHTLRIKAIGSQHQVWLDGTKIIDVHDMGRLIGGYINLLRDNSYVDFDNLYITPYQALPAATITGVAYDASEPTEVIADATIEIAGQTTTTNSVGAYTLTIPGNIVASGPISSIAQAPGYNNFSGSVPETYPGGTLTYDIGMTPLATSQMVFDSFSRADSWYTVLGNTEDDNHYPWVVNPAEALLRILGGNMYTEFNPWQNGHGASVSGGFAPADFDLSVDIVDLKEHAQSNPWTWVGIGYRQGVAGTHGANHGQTASESGYLVRFLGDGSAALISRNQDLTWKTFSPVIDWSGSVTVRIRVVGTRHQVWINGVKHFDFPHGEKTTGGFISLLRGIAGVKFDNLKVASGGLLPPLMPLPVEVTDVASVKELADGKNVELTGPVVTGVFDGFFYVEDENRSSGIKVVSSETVTVGAKVKKVVGTVKTADGEKYIDAIDVQTLGVGEVAPVALNGKAFANPDGLSNIGLLMTIYGKVTAVSGDQTYCYVDDGSAVSNEPDTTGIKVILPSTKKPLKDDYITAIGVSGMTPGGIPVLRIRSNDDLVILP